MARRVRANVLGHIRIRVQARVLVRVLVLVRVTAGFARRAGLVRGRILVRILGRVKVIRSTVVTISIKHHTTNNPQPRPSAGMEGAVMAKQQKTTTTTKTQNGASFLAGKIGKRVTLFGVNYIYTGTLVSINADEALLNDAGIVYETGKFSESAWKDYQPFPAPGEVAVRLSAVESITILK